MKLWNLKKSKENEPCMVSFFSSSVGICSSRYCGEVKGSSLCYLSMTGLVKVELSTPAEVAPVTPYVGLFLRCLHRCRCLLIAGSTYPLCVKLTLNNEDVSLKELRWGRGLFSIFWSVFVDCELW